MKEKERSLAIDLLKAFALILIIYGHVARYFDRTFLTNPVGSLFWLIQVPIFYFASGYLCLKEEKLNTIWKFLLRILKNFFFLLYPLFTYMLLRTYAFGQYLDLGVCFDEFWKNPAGVLWFLWVLFFMRLFMDLGTYISHFIVQKPLKMTIRFLPSLIAVVVFICLYGTRTVDVTYLGIALYLEYCLYYYLGIAVRELKDANKLSFLDNKLAYWILLILTGAVYFSFAFGLESSFTRHNKSQFVLGDPLNLLLSTCGVLFFYLVAIKIPKNKGTVLFSKLSKFSLESYWAHPNLLKWWGVWAVPNLALAYLSAFAMTLMCLGFILVSIFIIYQIPFLHFLAFGKSYSRYKFERKCLHYLS